VCNPHQPCGWVPVARRRDDQAGCSHDNKPVRDSYRRSRDPNGIDFDFVNADHANRVWRIPA
jgi:hypothetical protein